MSVGLFPAITELVAANIALAPTSPGDVDETIEEGRIAGTADVDEELGADTTVAMAEMLLVDDDNIEDEVADKHVDEGTDVVVMMAVAIVLEGVDVDIVVAVIIDVVVVVVNVVVAEIAVGSGEANPSISGSSSASVSPAATAAAAEVASTPAVPAELGGPGRAVPTIIVPLVLWT